MEFSLFLFLHTELTSQLFERKATENQSKFSKKCSFFALTECLLFIQGSIMYVQNEISPGLLKTTYDCLPPETCITLWYSRAALNEYSREQHWP